MVVQLSSLRVSASFDAAGYVTGAQAKEAADKRMVTSSREAGAAVAQVGNAITVTDAKVGGSVSKLDSLNRAYITAYRGAEGFGREILKVATVLDRAEVPAAQLDAILSGIYVKFNQTADAAVLAAAGHIKLSEAVGRLNERYQVTAEVAARAAAAQRAGAAAQSFQSGINSQLGVRTDFGAAERGADIAAYGAELDRLRARFNPLFSVITQYRETLSQVRAAHAAGAISTDEMTAAIGRERSAALASIAAIKGIATATPAGRPGAGSFQTANIAAQLQDVLVTGAAPGSNAITIALQQGPQLSAVLEQLKGEGKSAGAALAGAFTSILSPLSLATIAAVALGAVTLQAFAQIARSGETAAQAIERYSKGMSDVVAGYKGADAAAKSFAESASQLPIEVIEAKLGKTLVEAGKEVESFKFKAYNVGIGLTTSFNKSEAAVGNLLVSFSKGKTTASELQVGLAKIGATDLGFLNFGLKGIIDSMSEGVTTARALEGVLVSIEHTLAAAATNGGTQIALDSYVAGKKSAESHQIEMDALNAKSPAQLADIARRRVALELSDQEISESLKKQKIDEAASLAYAQASKGLGDADRNRLRALNDNVAAQQVALDVVGKSVSETERLTFARQNLAAAEAEAAQNGTMVSAAYRAEVERLAAAYGKLQEAIAVRKLGGDLQFDRDQLFRTSTEQTVASTLRPIYGDDVTSSQAQFLANQIRVNEQLKDLDSIGQDITSGFLSTLKADLKNGVSFFDALGNAGVVALEKIADKALSMAADGIWDMLFGAVGKSLFGGGALGNDIGPGAGFGELSGFLRNAKGGVFSGAGISSYSSSIVNRPTVFAFAKGMGLMGEAGEEAIMPLSRNSRGQLGVQVANSNASAANQNGGGVVINIENNNGATVEAEQTGTDGAGRTVIAIAVKKAVGQVESNMAKGSYRHLGVGPGLKRG